MGLRQMLNENRSVTIGAAVGITLLAILWIIWFCLTGGEIPGAPRDISPPPATSQSIE